MVGHPIYFPNSALLIQSWPQLRSESSASATRAILRAKLDRLPKSVSRPHPRPPTNSSPTTAPPSTPHPKHPPCHLSNPSMWRISHSQELMVQEKECLIQQALPQPQYIDKLVKRRFFQFYLQRLSSSLQNHRRRPSPTTHLRHHRIYSTFIYRTGAIPEQEGSRNTLAR